MIPDLIEDWLGSPYRLFLIFIFWPSQYHRRYGPAFPFLFLLSNGRIIVKRLGKARPSSPIISYKVSSVKMGKEDMYSRSLYCLYIYLWSSCKVKKLLCRSEEQWSGQSLKFVVSLGFFNQIQQIPDAFIYLCFDPCLASGSWIWFIYILYLFISPFILILGKVFTSHRVYVLF